MQQLLLVEYSLAHQRISPLHLVASAYSLQLPGELRELGVVLFALVLQACLVVSMSFLKCRRRRANVFHGGASTLHGDACLIDQAFGEALSSQQACFFSSSAIAAPLSLQVLPGCRGVYAGIVVFDESGHVMGVQLQLFFTVPRLKIWCSLLPAGRCLVTKCRNISPILVFTSLL